MGSLRKMTLLGRYETEGFSLYVYVMLLQSSDRFMTHSRVGKGLCFGLYGSQIALYH